MPANESAGLWWTRTTSGSGDEASIDFHGYDTPDHPSGTVIDTARSDLTPIVVVTAGASQSRVRSLLVPDGGVAAGLWWVEHPETSADPPAMTLMAFAGNGIAPGAVIDQLRFRSLGIASSQQYGAVRWWPSTGQIHQVYVAPERRRQGIGRALIFGSVAYSRARGWALLWGSGQRTDLGEAFLTNVHSQIRGRIEPRTHRLPPMTPPERAEGLPTRFLEPDEPV